MESTRTNKNLVSKALKVLPVIIIALGVAISLSPESTVAQSGDASAGHISNMLLPEGCGSCHVGHGESEQPMLAHSEEDFCYQCHGGDSKQAAMKSAGKLAEVARLADIEREFRKPYRHPVAEGFGHSPTEELPTLQARGVQHAECVDCHNPHDRAGVGTEQSAGIAGYSLSRQYMESANHEYQICMKCHTDAVGFASPETDLARAFSVGVTSQHPVTKPSSSATRTVSLLSSAANIIQMKCSDCHTNDDPDGPRGPHGSNYPYMLSGNYNTDGFATESPYNYAFCYSCHDRSSILGNESFPLHREHIEGDPISGIAGTSCYTCHSSHSSQRYTDLIRFNQEVVSRNTQGRLEFISNGLDGTSSGSCYLSCHGHDHEAGEY